MTVRPFAFVLMPFTQDFDDIYKLGIQAACSKAGVLAERVDEQTYSETILERIYRQIQIADFVIADMTGRNANVFYEVGYTHARSKLCTLLTQSADDIPFDLKHHRHIVYGDSIQALKAKLSVELEWLKVESGKLKTQSLTVEITNVEGILSKNDWPVAGDISLAVDLHNHSGKRSPEIDSIYLYTTHDWELTQGGEKCPITSAPDGPAKFRTFLKPPVQRLLPGGWAQIKLTGSRRLWTKWSGEEIKATYKTASPIHIELHTSEGVLKYAIPVSVDFEEVPF